MRFQSETFVFKFLRCSVEGKHLMRFQSETSVFKFPPRSVDGDLGCTLSQKILVSAKNGIQEWLKMSFCV